jgi:Rad3-related DNA helicase
MEMKDDIIGRLNEELVKKEGLVRVEADRLREKYENEIYDMKADYEDRISGLVSKIERIENELQNLDNYKRDKEIHDFKFAQLEAELLSEQHNNVLMLEDQERSVSFTHSHCHLLSLSLSLTHSLLL